MKNKITASLLALSIVFTFASCGTDDTKKAAEESAVTETEISEAAEEVTEAAEEEKQISFDFTGLDSEKSIRILTSDKYHIKYSYDYEGKLMYQDVYVSGKNTLLKTSFMNTEYSILYRDKCSYTIMKDFYWKSSGEDDEDETSELFEGFGYVRSGETELNGKNCRYDEYYQDITDSYTWFILSENNELIALETADRLMMVEECDSDFNPDEVINLPENCSECTEEEFNVKFLEAVASNTNSEALSDEKSDE